MNVNYCKYAKQNMKTNSKHIYYYDYRLYIYVCICMTVYGLCLNIVVASGRAERLAIRFLRYVYILVKRIQNMNVKTKYKCQRKVSMYMGTRNKMKHTYIIKEKNLFEKHKQQNCRIFNN